MRIIPLNIDLARLRMAVFGVLDPNVPQTCHVCHGGSVCGELSEALQRNAKPRNGIISATQRTDYTRPSMRPGFQTSLAFALACCRRNNRSNAFWRDPGAFLMLKRCGLTTTALFLERPVRGSCVCRFDMPTRRWSLWHCAEDSNDAFVVVAVARHRNFVVRRTKFHRVGGVSIIAGSSCRGFQPLPNLAAVNRATSPCKSRVLHVMSSSNITAASPRRVFEKRDRRATGPRLDRA